MSQHGLTLDQLIYSLWKDSNEPMMKELNRLSCHSGVNVFEAANRPYFESKPVWANVWTDILVVASDVLNEKESSN